MTDMNTPHDEELELEETQDPEEPSVPPEDTVDTTPTNPKKREILYDDEGNAYLVITLRNKFRPPRERRLNRRPKPIVHWDRYELLLTDNGLVNHTLVKNSDFVPVPGENSFLVYTRLHWWSHGPQQFGVALLALLGTAFFLWFVQHEQDLRTQVIALITWIAVIGVLAVTYVVVWIPWAYHHLIVTNVRVILAYNPPFGLPGDLNTLFLKDVQSARTLDQAVAKYIPSWGNLLPKFNITGYKILKGDSAAQDDAWFRDGIHYVRRAEDVERAIASARAEAVAVESERHEEDMDFQQRQAIASERAAAATEETRNMLQEFLQRNGSTH